VTADRPVTGQSLTRLGSFLRKHWRLTMAFMGVTYGPLIALLLLLIFWPAPPLAQPFALEDSTRIYDRHGRLLYEVVMAREGTHTYVPFEQIPESLREATIAVEDASFYSNPGFDVFAMGRALVQNLRAGSIVAGGSTITQQLVRNLYFSREERASRSPWRKVRETILAFRLARHVDKDKILELYLNQVYYGNLAYGVEAAARTYFGKSARDLDLAEASLLAGLPQSPAAYDPLANLSAAKQRQRSVLSLMERRGYISQAEADAAFEEPLHFAEAIFPMEAPHFVVYVRNLLDHQLGAETLEQGGLRVYTSLDLDIQHIAEGIVQRHVASLADHEVSNAALTALDPTTGQILAMVGSADYFDEDIDGAVNMALAPRQPGSSIKPITYAAALSRGYTAATPIADVRTSFFTRKGELYTPDNYDAQFHGLVSLRYALGSSLNVPAVQVMDEIGVDTVLRLAHDLGITTLDDIGRYDLSLTLGGGEVRLLDLTAAYAAFASGGVRREPAAILRVEDSSGQVLYEWKRPPEERVLSPQVAYLITDILSDNRARMLSFGEYSPLRLSRPAAAKTGTTSDFRDNWTIGYSPNLVAGVWVGNADNRAMHQVSGVTGAGPIWHDFMEEVLKDTPRQPFSRPEGLVETEVCEPTGLLPGPWCLQPRRELFVAGSQPTTTETYYRALEVCASTGELASPSCPPEEVVARVFVFPPPEVIPWAREAGLPLALSALELPDGAASSFQDGIPGGNELQVRIVSPEPGLVAEISGEIPRGHQAVEIEAVVWGPSITGVVELYDNGTLLASLRDAPYRILWPLVEGTHRFTAVAYDGEGNRAASEIVEARILP
jgi:1A family penicillin-binding protein